MSKCPQSNQKNYADKKAKGLLNPIVRDIMIPSNNKISVQASDDIKINTKVGKDSFEIEI